MDCERFDRVVLDLLYDELDELTGAAARRHVDGCARCRNIASGLRATREVGALPSIDPPEGLELKILEAERRIRERLPLRQRLGRAVSVLAGYAMRPQLAMAALLLLVIGSSLVFLRARPGDRDSVLVTEHGVPESDSDSVTIVPMSPDREAPAAHGAALAASAEDRDKAPPSASAQAAAGEAEDRQSAYESAMVLFRDRRYDEARQQFEAVAAKGGSEAAEAALYAANSENNSNGCSAAAGLFDQVPSRFPGTRAGYEATWQAAECYETLGETENARRSYQALLDDPTYAERAKAALAQLDRAEGNVAVAARKAAAKAEAPPPAAAAPRAAPKAAGGYTPMQNADIHAAPPEDAKK
jgi:hypothetical protein